MCIQLKHFISYSFMTRLLKYPFSCSSLLQPRPFPFVLARLAASQQGGSFKRMSRSNTSLHQSSTESSTKGSPVSKIFQRYARQKRMSETCRKWRTIPSAARRSPDDVMFTLMSYNILAQDLLEMHEDLYEQHDHVTLSWPHRYDRLLAEINLVRPDILCLQEMQDDHKEQFSNGLANFKYEMIFKKRTGDKPDGCAIYYRRDMFELVDYHDVEYYQPSVKVIQYQLWHLNLCCSGLIAILASGSRECGHHRKIPREIRSESVSGSGHHTSSVQSTTTGYSIGAGAGASGRVGSVSVSRTDGERNTQICVNDCVWRFQPATVHCPVCASDDGIPAVRESFDKYTGTGTWRVVLWEGVASTEVGNHG